MQKDNPQDQLKIYEEEEKTKNYFKSYAFSKIMVGVVWEVGGLRGRSPIPPRQLFINKRILLLRNFLIESKRRDSTDVVEALRAKPGLRPRNHQSPLLLITFYLTIRGGSRKKIAKKIIPKVPTRRNV